MSPLSGKRIFLVEDEYLLARQIARALVQEGAEVVGCVATVAAALDAVSSLSAIDIAILDVNLAGERVYPVADELVRRSIPFVFLSGYGLEDRDPRFADAMQLSKPITMRALSRALEAVFERAPDRPA